MCKPTPITADVTKSAGYVRVRILMNRYFFSYFWHSYFLTYGQFVEYMKMHAAGCWLDKTVWISPLYLIGDGRLCMNGLTQLGCVGGFDFALMASQLLGVSLQATRDTTKQMLGVSLRARWDATLVLLMMTRTTPDRGNQNVWDEML